MNRRSFLSAISVAQAALFTSPSHAPRAYTGSATDSGQPQPPATNFFSGIPNTQHHVGRYNYSSCDWWLWTTHTATARLSADTHHLEKNRSTAGAEIHGRCSRSSRLRRWGHFWFNESDRLLQVEIAGDEARSNENEVARTFVESHPESADAAMLQVLKEKQARYARRPGMAW